MNFCIDENTFTRDTVKESHYVFLFVESPKQFQNNNANVEIFQFIPLLHFFSESFAFFLWRLDYSHNTIKYQQISTEIQDWKILLILKCFLPKTKSYPFQNKVKINTKKVVWKAAKAVLAFFTL